MSLPFLSHVRHYTLINWLVFKGEQIWLVYLNITYLSPNIVNSLHWSIIVYFKFNKIMFGMPKTKHISKDSKRYMFNVSNLDIIWSSLMMLDFVYCQLWTSYEILFSLKYFTYLYQQVIALFYKSNFMGM